MKRLKQHMQKNGEAYYEKIVASNKQFEESYRGKSLIHAATTFKKEK